MHGEVSVVRRLSAELLGSALLAAVVVGSGIAAQRLSPDDVGLQLLENALATALGLPVLILMFATVSGSHFNPVVTLVDVLTGGRRWTDAAGYVPAQIIGCIGGAILANLMFGDPAVSISTTARLTPGTFLAEIVATAGLILVIFVLARTGRHPLVAVGGRRVHRGGVLLRQFDELRQSGHHHRAHLQRHVRRHRPRLGTRFHRGTARRRRRRPRARRLVHACAQAPHGGDEDGLGHVA